MNQLDGKRYLPRPAVARRYGVSERSIARWQADETLGFPAPMQINTRLFFAEDELETWERGRATTRKAA